MPAKTERTKVEIRESSTSEVRTFNITLTIPASEFQLTDLLRQRGVIESLDAQLKQAVKAATERYLKDAETLISGLVAKPNGMRKSRSTSIRYDSLAPASSGD